MIRVVIVGHDGKTVLPKDLSTADELRQVEEQAKSLIRECDRVARLKASQTSPGKQGEVPYLN